MRKTQGFTLVELLVVIAIIAVLVSILLPSLAKAKSAASVVQCASNLRQVALATINYANENGGALPPVRGDTGAANFSLGWAATTYAYTWNPSFQAAAPDPGAGIGRLINTKYIKSPNFYYCPSYDPSLPTSGFVTVFAQAYIYMPHYAWRNVNGTAVFQPWWKKIQHYGRTGNGAIPANQTDPAGSGGTATGTFNFGTYRRALALDNTDSNATSVHTQGNKRIYNLVYTDGSVTTLRTDSRFSRANGKWTRFYDMVNNAEKMAEGQQVNLATAWQNKENWIPVDPN
jgi:prepilin-type N-terminal cleavage/methylation domain-containing protein